MTTTRSMRAPPPVVLVVLDGHPVSPSVFPRDKSVTAKSDT